MPELVSTDVGLANALVKVKTGETLTESEELRVYAFHLWNFRGQEAYFREYQEGTYRVHAGGAMETEFSLGSVDRAFEGWVLE